MNTAIIYGTQNQPIITNGLVGFWSFNDGSGSAVRDYCGNVNFTDAIQTVPPIRSIGKFGTAFTFDGATTYISVNDSTYLVPRKYDWTITCWFNTTLSSHQGSMVGKRQNGGGYVQLDVGIGYVNGGGSGIADTCVYMFQYPGLCGIHSTLKFADGNWHHAAFTRPSSGNPTIYIDGVSQLYIVDSGYSVDDVNNPGVPWTFGNNFGAYYSGSIFGVRLYNRVLNQTEVSALYLAISP